MTPRIEVMELADMPSDCLRQSFMEQLTELHTHLSNRKINLQVGALQKLATRDGGTMVVAIDSDAGRMVGAGEIYFLTTSRTKKALIENVIVLPDYEGNGIGSRICKKLIQTAKEFGANKIELTSNPTRKSAHRLYGRLEFKRRDTNVYQLTMEAQK